MTSAGQGRTEIARWEDEDHCCCGQIVAVLRAEGSAAGYGELHSASVRRWVQEVGENIVVRELALAQGKRVA